MAMGTEREQHAFEEEGMVGLQKAGVLNKGIDSVKNLFKKKDKKDANLATSAKGTIAIIPVEGSNIANGLDILHISAVRIFTAIAVRKELLVLEVDDIATTHTLLGLNIINTINKILLS